jgi:hypothetical protein
MGRFRFVLVGLVAGLILVPQRADAQSSDGWWEWALREAVEAGARIDAPVVLDRRGDGKIGDRRRDRDRDEAGRGRTLEDIIFGRDRRGSRDAERRDRDRDDDRWEDRRDRDDDRWEDRRERDEERWEDRREREEERWEDRRDRDDRWEDRGRGEREGRGPPFCRNGQGHPVHGIEWCRDKGFGGYGYGPLRWEERGWEDVILRSPRRGDRGRILDRGGLIDILGVVVYRRVASERHRLETREPLTGRWLRLRDGGRVLQIRSGAMPIAELSDLDGDGRVDVALVPRR